MLHRLGGRSPLRALALISSATLLVAAPAVAAPRLDLKASSLVVAPTTLPAGGKLTARVKVAAFGAKARKSQTVLWLSRDAKLAKGDVKLGATPTKALKVGKPLTISSAVTVPVGTKPGKYRVLACADGARKLKERSERNNCATTKRPITVTSGSTSPFSGQTGSGSVPVGGGDGTQAPSPGASGATPQPGSDSPATPAPGPGGSPATPTPTPAGPTPAPSPRIDVNAPGDGKPGTAGTPSAIEPGTSESLRDSTAFLYTGPNAPQQGVAPNTISERRAVVLRGKVTDRAGNPLAGVAVTVLDHAEYGRTLTRADGGYDLVVNGGGAIVLQYNRTGFLLAQRRIQTPWQDYVFVDDVILIPLDTKVSTVDPSGPAAFSVATGTTTDDGDGKRTATLLFPKGTDAVAHMPDGSTKPITGPMHVRATEYTQGGKGIDAMPGSLPNSSGYTYAAEFSVDEAGDATTVTFDKPIIDYTENFIGAPVGSNVPTAWYDRTQARWVPSKNGRVIKVVSITGGKADLDVTGDGNADTGTPLTTLGITDAERTEIASRYQAGQELWRVAIDHFTPWDPNWPYGPDPDAEEPHVPDNPKKDPPKDPCEQGGSIIGCESQTLGERIPITGTPYALDYRSDRQPGWLSSQSVDIPLVGASVPGALRGVVVDVDVAGKRYEQRFTSVSPDQHWTFDGWDGRDAYGRKVDGTVPVNITLRYVYRYVYYASEDAFEASFAKFGDNLEQFTGRNSCGDAAAGAFDCGFSLSQKLTQSAHIASPWDAKASDHLGGWTLDVHHAYDANGHVIHMGDGTDQTGTNAVGAVAGTSSVVAGDVHGPEGTAGDGMDADQVDIDYLAAMTVGPDGSIYLYSSLNHNLIRRVTPDGKITTIGGAERVYDANDDLVKDHSGDPEGDGQPAVGSVLGEGVSGLAVGQDGSVYFGTADTHGNNYIRRIGPDGKLSTIAGIADHSGTGGNGDGGLAKNAKLSSLRELAVAPDGAVWFSEAAGYPNGNKPRIRRIDPSNGIISTEVGGGAKAATSGDTGAGSPGTSLNITVARGLSFANDGSLLFGLPSDHVVERLSGDGSVRRLAGTGASANYAGIASGQPALATKIGDPVAVVQAPNGTYFVRTRGAADEGDDLIVAIGGDGTVRPVAGAAECTASYSPSAPIQPAQDCIGSHAAGLGVTGDSNPIYSDGRQFIRRIHDPMPGFGEGSLTIPSTDGTHLYEFDSVGRHLRTVSASDGHAEQTFGYDAQHRLTSITDADGRKTVIERAGDGTPTAIVAPGGQRTQLDLDASGMLSQVEDPAGDTTGLAYKAGGMLTTYTDPGGGEHDMTYDASGRLTSDAGPDGTTKTLARGNDGDGAFVTLTTAEGRVTKYSSDRLDDGTIVRKEVDPGGATSTTTQHPDGTTDMTSPTGEQAHLEYAGDPRFGMQAPYVSKMTITAPSGRTETLTDDRHATLTDPQVPTTMTSFSDQRQHRWVDGGSDEYSSATTTYDRATRTLEIESPEHRRTTMTYDAHGHITEIENDGENAERDLAYDARGRLSVSAHGNQQVTYGYDAKDRLVSATDKLGHQIKYGYDDADRLVSVTTAGGSTWQMGYDADGNRTSITTPRGNVHRFAYTSGGELSSYTPPVGGQILGDTFDGDALMTTFTTPAGAVNVTRDAAGHVTGLDAATASDPDTSSSYLPDGRVDHQRTVPGGGGAALSDLASTWDGDQLIGQEWAGASTGKYTYGYNGQFRLNDMKLVSGGDTVDTAITRDDDGRITKLGGFDIEAGGPSGDANAISDAKLSATIDHDDVGRMKQDAVDVNGQHVYDLALTRDAAGRITKRVEQLGGAATTWDLTYDADGQLTGAKRNGVAAGTWTYDADGNRTDGGDQSYDANGVQTGGAAPSGVASDASGNLTHRGAWSFTYGTTGQLLSATDGTTTVQYTYDGTGHLAARRAGADTTTYLYGDPGNPDRVTASRGADGVLTTFLYGEDGRVFALKRGADTYYVGSDQAGSVRVVADATGTAVRTVEYDPWGKHLALSGSLDVALGFAGGVEDSATGLVRFGQRWYDPETGRFTTRDPKLFDGGQLNPYEYVGNDPVGHTDPSGLEWYNNWNDFNQALNTNVGHPVNSFVSEHWHDLVHYGEKLIGDSTPATVLKDGDSALDTASEIGDVIIEVQEAQAEKNPGKSAAGLLQCILKGIDKLPLPWNPVKPAGQILDQGVQIVDGYQGMGTKGDSQSDINYIMSGRAERE